MSEAQAPLVSIVTPVHNGGAYLRECIESVLAQTYTSWRHTIVDNRSSDDSLAIARDYARRDGRIRAVSSDSFLPIIEHHNRAISLLEPEAQYCKPLMGDDWLYPDCLEKMMGCALRHSRTGLVCSYAVTEQNKVLLDDLPRMHSPTTLLSGRDACRIALLEYRYFFGSPTTMLIRADLIRKRRPFYNPANVHADEESCYDVLRESDFGFVHQVLAFIRTQEGSQTNAGQALNTVVSGRVYALAKYGRAFLSEEEFQRRYRERMHEYYGKLAIGALEFRGGEFWEFHRRMLTALGTPLDKLRLARAILVQLLLKLTLRNPLARRFARHVG